MKSDFLKYFSLYDPGIGADVEGVSGAGNIFQLFYSDKQDIFPPHCFFTARFYPGWIYGEL